MDTITDDGRVAPGTGRSSFVSSRLRRLPPIGLAALALLHASVAVTGEGQIFREKIVPIFERSCVSCHAGERPRGKLSLVTVKGLATGGVSGRLFVPGKPDESLLVEVITGDVPEMPPKGDPLSADEIALIRRWIAEGAELPEESPPAKRLAGADDDWWSLRPLQRPKMPATASAWVRTPVDAFILAKLEEKGLSPSAEADRKTLIRRLTYDLHGLPPTPDEISAFLADQDEGSYERLVDRLLDSPRYGERWARHWLDVVHFGESHGYDKDKPRPNAWPYRDWVIDAFNSDKPYDRFVAGQIAGDVLSPDDPQGIVATGFIAAGPWDFVGHMELREGTLDKKITRSNDRDDMVATAMSSFLSLTVHCARCHDHKFDPISQEEYYRLQSVFAGIDRGDRPFDQDDATHRTRRELSWERESLLRRRAALSETLAKVSTPEIEAIEGELRDLRSRLALLRSDRKGAGSPTNGYHSAIMPTADAEKWVQVDLGRSFRFDEIVLIPARPTDFADTPGFGFPVRFRVLSSETADFSSPRLLADHTGNDRENPGDKPVVFRSEGKGRFVRVTATRLWPRTNDYVFALAELQVRFKGRNAALGSAVSALDSIEAGRWSTKHLVDGFTSRARAEPVEEGEGPAANRESLEKRIAELTTRRQAAVEERLSEADRSNWRSIVGKLASVETRLAALPAPAMVYGAAPLTAKEGTETQPGRPMPRAVHFLNRGSDKSPGKEVSPAALSCIAGLPGVLFVPDPSDEGSRRAALARWMIHPKNALVPRSIVNRVWQYHFGRGIVDTPNDFGHMGSLPTHPELLEWLAAEFVQSGPSNRAPWSLKRLHRLILTSAVYRQASTDDPRKGAIDSGNQYLWRMNRQRLDAEALRDAVLAVSGKLDRTMKGPSDRQFFFKDDHSPIYDYERFDVDSAAGFRRSVYRFIVRSVPDPFMECLDAADPSLMTPRRNTTLTALQALSLLNNAFMVRQAEHFAARVEAAATERDRQVELAYELALGREPTAEERRLVRDYAAKNGLANACRVIFNSNEFLFVD